MPRNPDSFGNKIADFVRGVVDNVVNRYGEDRSRAVFCFIFIAIAWLSSPGSGTILLPLIVGLVVRVSSNTPTEHRGPIDRFRDWNALGAAALVLVAGIFMGFWWELFVGLLFIVCPYVRQAARRQNGSDGEHRTPDGEQSSSPGERQSRGDGRPPSAGGRSSGESPVD